MYLNPDREDNDNRLRQSEGHNRWLHRMADRAGFPCCLCYPLFQPVNFEPHHVAFLLSCRWKLPQKSFPKSLPPFTKGREEYLPICVISLPGAAKREN